MGQILNQDEKAKLARIDERTIHLIQSLSEHAEEDNKRFERTFGYLKDSFDKIEGRFDKFEAKIGNLWDDKNKRSGAFGASRMIGGSIWAVAAVCITLGISWLLK